MSWINHPIVEQLGLALVHFVWQGALIGALFAISLPLTRGASARTRYGIAVVALALLAAAPPVTLALLISAAGSAAAPADIVGVEAALMTAGAQGLPPSGAWPWMGWLVAAWLAGVVVLSLRLALGWRFLRKLRREADHDAAAGLTGVLESLVARLDIRRSVAVALSDGIRSPIVIGWLKPLVLLPPAIVAGLPARQLEMVLAHELAHVRRLDHLVNVFQTGVEIVLFYHPVVRWVSRRIRIERENACDDLAVSITADRLSYVEMLASLEKLRFEGPRLALAVHDGQVLSRIRRLVEQGSPARQLGLAAPALMGGVLLAAVGGLQLMPQPAPEQAPDQAAEVRVETAPNTPVDPVATPAAAVRSEVSEAEGDGSPALAAEPAAASPEPSPATRRTAAGPTAGDTESQPPALPRLETDRLPPAAELLSEPEPVRLAMVERPALVAPTLPEPRPASSPATREPEITGGALIERIEPDYPIRARQRGIDGSVAVEFLVTPEGRVREIEVVDEKPRGLDFGEAASEAISRWRFEPFREDDSPIERLVRLEVAFNADRGRDCKSQLGSRIPRC